MGRVKQFEPDTALEAIKNVFWQNGYEGSSLHDLELATGLQRQSLYREFGNKRSMYLAALREYERVEVKQAQRLLRSADNPVARFTLLFETVIGTSSDMVDRRGCLLCNAAADRTSLDSGIGQDIVAALDRLRAGFAEALVPVSTDETLADALLTGYVGLRVLTRTGMDYRRLLASANALVSLIGPIPAEPAKD